MKRMKKSVISLILLVMLVPLAVYAQDDNQLCNLAFEGQVFQRIACNDFFQRLYKIQVVDAEVESIAARYVERQEVFDLIPWPVTPVNDTEGALVSAWLEGAKAEHTADLARLTNSSPKDSCYSHRSHS